jgi:hypothetical protein
MLVLKSNTQETWRFKGADHGASIAVILDRSVPGQGPRLHRHPYDETHANAEVVTEWLE